MIDRTGSWVGIATLVGAWFVIGSCVDDKKEPRTETVESVVTTFLDEYSKGNAEDLGRYFAPKVAIHGDTGFLGTETPSQPRKVFDFSSGDLVDGYSKFFEKVGKERWAQMTTQLKPTLVEAKVADEPFPGVEVGDFVYDLHFREAIKGEARGLDEAVIFVFRKLGQNYKIVAHYADF